MAKPLRPRNGVQKKQDSGKPVQKSTQIEIYVPLIVSVGNDNRAVLHPEWVETIVAAIKKVSPESRVTPTGGYYLIDGKMCRVADFDPETMDRKPGTFPPDWSMTPQEREEMARQKRIAENAKQTNDLAKQPVNLPTSRELDERARTVRKAAPLAKEAAKTPIAPAKRILRRKG